MPFVTWFAPFYLIYMIRQPSQYFTCKAVGEATKGIDYDPTLHPKATILQQVTFLWANVKRLEGQAYRLDGTPFHFIEEYQSEICSVYFQDGSVLYICEPFEILNPLFLASKQYTPGLLGN
jgi:hypothetical protein